VEESVTPPDETAERWLPVPGWEGLYEVSNKSRVRSLERTKTWRGREVPVPARVLRQWTMRSATPSVALFKAGERAQRSVRLLVEEAFGVPPAMHAGSDLEEPERWLPVVDYEGLYMVSDLGNVRSLHKSARRRLRGDLLSPAFAGEDPPHWCVSLTKGGKAKTWRIHRLVMEAFVGPCPEGQEVRHGPGGNLDSRLVNLCYGTHTENVADMVRDGTRLRGEQVGGSRLTEQIVIECRRRYAAGETQTALCTEFGVSSAVLSQAITGARWAWVPGAVPGDGKSHKARGSACAAAKLTPEIVREARRRSAAGESFYVLATEYGVRQSTLWAAVRGHTWKDVI
jgi:hypothetical protein